MDDVRGQWIVGEARRRSGGSVMVRLLALQPIDWAVLVEAVVIAWSFPDLRSFDLLDTEMQRIEDRMLRCASSRHSCLALVLTYADRREWTFYTSDSRTLATDLSRVTDDAGGRFEIREVFEPGWPTWKRYRSPC